MKIILIIPVLLILAGCMSSARKDEIMNSWIGYSMSELIERWGPPHQIIPDGDNGKIVSYIYKTSGQLPTLASNIYSGQTVYQHGAVLTKVATNTFWIDSDNIIYKASWTER